MRKPDRWHRLIALTCAGVLLVCATAIAESKKQQAKAAQEAEALRAEVADCLPPEGMAPTADVAEVYDRLAREGNRNAVLCCYTIGLRALQAGRTEEAARVLDAAVSRLERSSVGDKAAKKARSKFHGESEKSFRGEPFEQALIYLMRGLVYMQQDDFENARACFRSAALQDRSAQGSPEGEAYQDDMAEMDYLEALCDFRLKDANAEECMKRARQKARTSSAVYAPPQDFNAVVLFFSGEGPAKYRTGQYSEYLRFSPGNGAICPVKVKVGKAAAVEAEGPTDSMTFQATTRGGREVDAILKGKAQFKTGAGMVGDLALAAGIGAAASPVWSNRNSDGAAAAGLALIAIGAVAKGVSSATNPAADARALSPIPDDVYVFPLKLSPGENAVQFESPETGVTAESRLVSSGKPCDALVVRDPEFGRKVQEARRHKMASVDPNASIWVEHWAGELKIRNDSSPLTVLVDMRNENRLFGVVKATGAGTDGFVPCRGAADDHDFRVEFRTTIDLNNPGMYRILLGKTSEGGRKAAGDYYVISGGQMTATGSFEVQRQDAGSSQSRKIN